jgi:hypothetical protein
MAEKKVETVRAPLLERARLRLVPLHDRLLLDGATSKDAGGKEKEIAMWLTRHVALVIFQKLRASLEQGSATAGKVAPGWRQEALALEHAAILKTNAGKGPGAPWRGEGKPQLLTRVTVKPLQDRVQIGFWNDKNALAALVLPNAPLHRFCAMLALRIQQAGWDKGLDLSWLGKPPAPQVPAGKPN